jgi:hypothetical protein
MFAGRRGLVFGCGPSLDELPPEALVMLRSPMSSIITISVGWGCAAEIFLADGFKPRIHFRWDVDRRMDLFLMAWKSGVWLLAQARDDQAGPVDLQADFQEFFRRKSEGGVIEYEPHYAVELAMLLLYYMGIRKIYLAGVDNTPNGYCKLRGIPAPKFRPIPLCDWQRIFTARSDWQIAFCQRVPLAAALGVPVVIPWEDK